MNKLYFITTSQVCNRARQYQDAVIGTRREVQLVHGGAHQLPAGIVQLAMLAQAGGLHVGVTGDLVGRAASSGGCVTFRFSPRPYEAETLQQAGDFDLRLVT